MNVSILSSKMKLQFLLPIIALFALQSKLVSAWDNDDLEIFDLVEEINENFYKVLNVEQDASAAEIRKAFRALSIVLHPDKNDAEDANVQFRNLVSVYEVLKDSSKREKYNDVLKNGLPNWKSAVYYYRHVRKMGLTEMAIILFVIITVCQYIISWAAYAEKKYTAESLLGTKIRKLNKKSKNAVDIDSILNSIPTPSVTNTLPFQLVRGVWNTPSAIKSMFHEYADYKQQQREEQEREAEELERQRLLEEEIAKEKEARKEGVRKRKPVFAVKEKTAEELKGYSTLNTNLLNSGSGIRAVTAKEPVVSGGIWTDDDLAELIRLVKKYPNGTLSRWEVIAGYMNRSVQEVTFMAARMKESGYRLPNEQTESIAEAIVQETVKKVKRVVDPQPETKNDSSDALWSQEQQKLLETAIVKYPKTSAGDRWQKISNTVPGKTKEECLARYKYLVDKVKAQKAAKETELNEKFENIADNAAAEEQTPAEEETTDQKIMDEVDIAVTEHAAQKSGGKPRNKRKERKKQMEFSSGEDENDDL